ncbi:MAG TPA: hypothetical protein VIG40_00530 [Tissierellaceae bacterium]
MKDYQKFIFIIAVSLLGWTLIIKTNQIKDLEEELVDKTIEASEMKDLYRLQIDLIDKMIDKLERVDENGK